MDEKIINFRNIIWDDLMINITDPTWNRVGDQLWTSIGSQTQVINATLDNTPIE